MSFAALLIHSTVLARLAAPYPFAVGERLQYDAKLGFLPIGTATVTVSRMVRERGTPAFVFAMTGQGGPPGLQMSYEMTSWVRSSRFASLRFHRRLVQGRSVTEERYQIIPDSSRYRQEGVPRDWAAPSNPLDELAFLYYLRTMPLAVGGLYQVPRYFKTGYNPIDVRVVGRQQASLPNGTTAPVLVLEVTSRGLMMGVHLTDDARRLPVELTVPLPYGTVTLELAAAA